MENEFLEFLINAKRKGFASRFSIPHGIFTGKRWYEFSKGPFRYLDEYVGTLTDQSTESVFYDNQKIWGMKSSGGMNLDSTKYSGRCFRFLKECLRNTPRDFPVRGPMEFRRGLFLYKNQWEGDLDCFSGNEVIILGEKEIYTRDYSGRNLP